MIRQDNDKPTLQEERNRKLTRAERKAKKRDAKAYRIWGRVFFSSLVMAALLVGIGGWAATAELSGAVIASGSVVVEQNVKKIQHRDGGIVSKIHIRNGDQVRAGQVILEIDATQIRAELGVVRAQLVELIAQKFRLLAEIDGLPEVSFPENFEAMSPGAQNVAERQRRLFTAARSEIKSQIEQLELQIGQLRAEISGINSQSKAKQGQIELVKLELGNVSKLHKKGLIPVTRLYALQRQEKQLRGELGGLTAQVARTRGKISETRLQILSVSQSARLGAQRELRSAEAKISELSERETAAKDKLARTKLFAPQEGTVHELAVHTIGGVITAAETALVIVPKGDRLTIEVQINPVNIDQVTVGRPVNLRFVAFNQETTPELTGRVVQVSADVTVDPRTSQTYYLGRVEVDEASKPELGNLKLLPGMPVEVYIATGKRTALSYFSKPITDQFFRAFREN